MNLNRVLFKKKIRKINKPIECVKWKINETNLWMFYNDDGEDTEIAN